MEERRDLKTKAAGFPPTGEHLPSAAAIQNALAKVLASRTFRSASAQKKFLNYAVHESLAGRAQFIKEYSIGTEALGRSSSFDPRLDPIVRTEARKLRVRLGKYYQGEGADDLILIDLPKGSYAPTFGPRDPKHKEPGFETKVDLPAKVVVSPPADFSPPSSGLPRRWAVAASAIGLMVVLGAAGLYASRSGLLGISASAHSRTTIAVLPFANLGSGNADDFLSDGLTEELIESLKHLSGLEVTARTSAFRYKGDQRDLREIGRQLHVQTVLLGTVESANDRIRISVHLNNAVDGSGLWSANYDRDAKDAGLIQREISQAVASALRLGVSRGVEAAASESTHATALPNPAAYRDYLKGRYFWNRLTPEGLKIARQFFERAIAEDPSYARAYAALADCYVIAPQVSTTPASEVVPMIQSAAERALELDSTLGEAHLDLAVSAEYRYDWRTADQEFKKGLELSPGSAVGHLWYAKYLALVGRTDQVLIQRRIAAELDPVSPYAVQAVGGYYSVMGRYDEAIEQFQGALALEPDFGLARQGLGVAYLLKGNHPDAISELQAANKHMPGTRRMALLGYAYAVSGHTPEARRILAVFLEQNRREPFPALAIAQIYIGLGEKDRAFEWLQKAIEQRDLDTTLLWDSFYQGLRSDPRFQLLLRNMKLAA